jgi:hypothetical protein
MLLIAVCGGIVACVAGGRLPVRDGCGWDGAIYADIVRGFPDVLLERRLDAYRAQRVLPSVIVALGLRGAGITSPTAHDVVAGFRCYHLALLAGGVVVWLAIARAVQLGRAATWMGFMALYLNVAVGRMTFYYAPLTDTTAWFCGLLACWLWLRRRWIALASVALVGAFAWPILPVFCACLMLDITWPRLATWPHLSETRRRAWERLVPVSWFVLVPLGFAGVVLHRYFARNADMPYGAEPVWPGTLPLAACIAGLYLATGLGLLFRREWPPVTPRATREPGRSWRRELAYRLVLVAAVFAAIQLGVKCSADPSLPTYRWKSFLEATCLGAVAKPGLFALAHAVYFGPIVLLGILNWRQVARVAARVPVALPARVPLALPVLRVDRRPEHKALAKPVAHSGEAPACGALGLALTLVLALTSESRHLIAFVPLFVTLVVLAIERQRAWKWQLVTVFSLASFVASKCWLPPPEGPFDGSFADFPCQQYFMNHGPWMSTWSYAVQGAAALCVGLGLAWAQWQGFRHRWHSAGHADSLRTLIRRDLVFVLQRQANVIQPVQQTVAPEPVHLE